MPPVYSHRHPVNFYGALFLWMLFWAFMTLMSSLIFFGNYGTAQFTPSFYGLIFMAAVEFAGAIYTLQRFFKLAPTIELTNEYVRFYSTLCYWSDVEKIELHGKRPYIFFTTKEGTSIVFKSGAKRVFLDGFYSNTGEIKRFIQDIVIDKKTFVSAAIDSPGVEEASGENFTTYIGAQLYNYRGIALWLIEIVMIYIVLLNRASHVSLVFCAIIMPLSLLGFSRFMNYFELSDRFLLVRKHNLVWRKQLYRLSDIKEVVFEQPEKMPVCLRVITNDFESKQYPAGTLWNKDWRALRKALTERNVSVRNESWIGYES